MPVPNLAVWRSVSVRLVVALCAFTLLATAVAGMAEPAAGAELGAQISSGRRGQSYYQRVMLTQDRRVASVKSQMKGARRAVKQARRSLKQARRSLRVAKRVLPQRRARLKAVSSVYGDPSEAPKPWRYEKRLRQLRQDVRIAQRHKAGMGRRVRASHRVSRARHYRHNSLKRQLRSAVYARESAEAVLGGLISQMTRLAASRAQGQSAVSLSAGGGSFSWPSTGRVVQRYGCTGFRLNPRRGSCRHFHDGLDIVDRYGTSVRAAAVGVVAYVGWNPWDESGRAWIVVVAHPNGYVTRYGHLIPTKRVRAGALVHTGQVIGKMGSTGRSTGTHLHFELLRGGNTVDPHSYLPSGVVKIKVDKKSTKKGVAKAKKKARVKQQKAAKRKAVKARKRDKRAAMRAATRAVEESELTACQTIPGEAPHEYLFVTGIVSEPALDGPDCTAETAAGTESDTPMPAPKAAPKLAARADVRLTAMTPQAGIRLPSRGTSPIPS